MVVPLCYIFVEGVEPKHILDRRDDLHNKIEARISTAQGY